MTSPTKRDWAKLHESFRYYCQVQPWMWMSEAMVAVEEPKSGETVYCVVMGGARMEYGLAVFVGDDGYRSYAYLMTEEADPESLATVSEMRSLSAILADRANLSKKDLAVIRSTGLRYRGRGAWPLFRSVAPGYLPWFLDAQEARLLTVALNQMALVALRVLHKGLVLWNQEDPELVFTRCYRAGEWKDEWRRAAPPQPSVEVPDFPDRARLQRLLESSSDRLGSWELSRFRMPTSVQEKRGERPFLPAAIMAVEREVGLVIDNRLLGPNPTIGDQQEAVVAILEKSPLIPEELLVDHEDAVRMLEPITRTLGIKISVDRLPALERARDALMAYVSGL